MLNLTSAENPPLLLGTEGHLALSAPQVSGLVLEDGVQAEVWLKSWLCCRGS